MMFEREVHEQYKKAYALALRNLRDKKKMRLPLCPAAHITLPDEKMVSYRIDLGIIEIPTNLIIGVSEETEDTLLYTKGFLPISAPNSAFADLWRSLYQTLQSDHGFSEEISCCEYLGKFYVQDGLKRVSVGKFLGIPVMKARVIRIFPMHMDAQEAAVYFDFLRCYRLTKLYQLQFTQAGFFEKLQTALGRKPGERWSDADRTRFLVHWPVIEYAFHKSYEESLRISAADALVVLLNKFSFEQIIEMDGWVLARVFQALWKELYTLSFPDQIAVKMNPSIDALHNV